MRGEWIEISCSMYASASATSLPSCEGSGLKLDRLCRSAHATGVSPHARGVDLNVERGPVESDRRPSPLMRGEWIEMAAARPARAADRVSPHARGVD